MRKLCIIPARGGSKRIPRKNIKNFLGKPIIAYSIEAALESGLFSEVMVSTDDEEIASIAKFYGASVPFLRTEKNADDFSTTSDVIIEVLENYKNEDKTFLYACCIYPTAPFVSTNRLKEGFEKLIDEKRNTVFPFVEFSYPIWRGLRKENDGKVKMVWPDHLNSRSQDLEKVYHDAGQWYWLDVKAFCEEKNIFTDNSTSIILDPMEVQDIDNLSDWNLAELKYEYLQKLK